ncbi:MAG: outer membrane protein assembly factor BamD [Candidatus Delongbacteria bacterium]
MFKSCRLLLLPGFLLVFIACSQQPRELDPVDQVMARAMRSFEKGRFVDALDRFTRMSLNYAGSSLMDSVRYMEAECQYQLNEYLLAADLYQELITRYPTSPLVDEARLRTADCWFELSPHYALDQTYTIRAIDEYQGLLDDYADSPHRALAEERISACRHKLALKDLRSAELYVRMEQWPAALLYLNDVLETWYDQPDVMERALYFKGITQLRMKRLADARASLEEYLATWPDGEHAAAVRQELSNLQ